MSKWEQALDINAKTADRYSFMWLADEWQNQSTAHLSSINSIIHESTRDPVTFAFIALTLFGLELARHHSQQTYRRLEQEPVLNQLRRRQWNWLQHRLRTSDDNIDKQALQLTSQGHRSRGRQRTHMEERSRQRDMDNRLQVQLEEDGGGSTRQSWMIKTSGSQSTGKWTTIHWQPQGISQVICSNLIDVSAEITRVEHVNFVEALWWRWFV